ncbi:MAG: DNA-binding protein WhiA [Fretibacterium sp.]|nr:DNA-binding protein WhiA [Fretibacterium sp.]
MLSHRDKLTGALWDEWGACPVEGRGIEAECMGLLAGFLPNREGGREGPLRTNRLRVARRLLKLWRWTPWYPDINIADAVAFPDKAQGRRGSVLISLPLGFQEEVERFARDLAQATESPAARQASTSCPVVRSGIADRPDAATLSSHVSQAAWLRGLWGSCGGLYLPKSGYYVVFRVAHPSVAGPMRTLLSRTGLPWRGRVFHGAQEMFLRDQESIVTFLCNLGLPSASLQIEDRMIMRSLRDQANRVSNCDTANIRRSLRVAEEQTRLASRARSEGVLPLLPPALRQLAEARLANPEASLSELGNNLSPPIQKSTVKYRWARLSDYVSKYNKGVLLN